jgi:ATP-binding cassette subfamily B protein
MKNNSKDKLDIMIKGMKIVQKTDKYMLPLSFLSAALKSLSPFVNIYMSAAIIDELLNGRSIKRLVFYAGLTIGLNLIISLVSKLLDRVKETLNFRIDYQILFEMDRVILNTDYENVEKPDFHLKKQKIYEAYNMNHRGLWVVPEYFEKLMTGLFTVIISIIMAAPLFMPAAGSRKGSFISSPWLSLLFLLLVVLSSIFSVVSDSKFSKILYKKMDSIMPMNRKFSFYGNLINDCKFGKDVRIYNQKELLSRCYKNFTEESDRYFSNVGNLNGRFSGIIAAVSAILGGAVYLFVGLKALAGIFSIGSVVKYVGAINQFTAGLTNLATTAAEEILNGDYVKLYIDFLNTPNPKYKGTLPVEKRNDDEFEIEFRNVSFKYPGASTYALKNLSIKLHIGERLAVVGMNGSGKTTFIKLLCRLYDPQEGEILLNGINIKKYDYKEYLSLFSVVFQDFQLFAASAGENVASSVDYDRDKVLKCIKEAGAEGAVKKMKKGLDTPLYKVDENGADISGGEAQKIAIARALYKDSHFIILDEPTAALDPIAEYEIYSKFNDIVGTKTAVYISHRLSSCRFCDDIAVFDNGRLIERGSHEELVKDKNSKYYELWNAQAQYYKKSA